MERKTCYIYGNVDNESLELYGKLKKKLEELIFKYEIENFLFNESGKFSYICYELLSEIKNSNIKRIYCYGENIIKQNFYDYKQLSNGLYDDFLCVVSGSFGEKNRCIEIMKIIDKCDYIFLNFKDNQELVDFIRVYAQIKNKEIIFFNELRIN